MACRGAERSFLHRQRVLQLHFTIFRPFMKRIAPSLPPLVRSRERRRFRSACIFLPAHGICCLQGLRTQPMLPSGGFQELCHFLGISAVTPTRRCRVSRPTFVRNAFCGGLACSHIAHQLCGCFCDVCFLPNFTGCKITP